jgi:uncharacterized protein (TIGR02246 family)
MAFACAACGMSQGGASFDRAAAETEIREMERAWAHVAVSGNPAIIERIFTDDFLGVSPEGAQYTKRMFIDDTNAHPLGFLANEIDDIKVRFYGEVAVAQGSETFTRKGGDKGRFVWTDVLVRRDGAWKIAAAQDVVAPAGGAGGTPAQGAQAGAAGPGPGATAPGAPGGGALFTGAEGAPEARQGIDATRKAYAAAWQNGIAAEVANVYTPDAQVLYPDRPPISGHDAIVEYFTGFFTQFPKNQFELISKEVVINGPWAFDQGTYRWKGTPRAGGAPEEDYGKYLVILQRQPDGTWKVARDMDNSDRPAAQGTRGSHS